MSYNSYIIHGTFLLFVLSSLLIPCAIAQETAGVHVATFDMDVTPPVGADMAYDPVIKTWDMR